jgi:hypothetical protein
MFTPFFLLTTIIVMSNPSPRGYAEGCGRATFTYCVEVEALTSVCSGWSIVVLGACGFRGIQFGFPCAALSVKANVCALGLGMSWDLCSGACLRSDYTRAASSPLPPGMGWTPEWYNSGVSGLWLPMCRVERKSERVRTWDKLGLCSGALSPASFWLSGGYSISV